MNFKNLVWKNRHARIWLIVSVSVLIFIFVVTMVATQVPLFRGSINLFLGGYRARLGDARYLFDPDFDSKDEVFAAANKLNIEIAEEGFTLLRNEPLGAGGLTSLPLRGAAPRVSVFGNNSIDLLYGGSGSGDGYVDRENKTIFESLTAAGIVYNPALPAFYNSAASGPGRPESPGFVAMLAGFRTGQTPWVNYNAQLRNTFRNYSDAALVVITRIGGEGYDLPRTVKGDGYLAGGTGVAPEDVGSIVGDPIPGFDNRHRIPAPQNNIVPTSYDTISGHRDEAGDRVGGHYLQLCNNEIDLLLNVSYYFDNVIIVINSNNILELSFLIDAEYWFDVLLIDRGRAAEVNRAIERIRSAIWIGSPGSQGIMALGRILNGTVNPSGRTVSTHARDFSLDPTWNNFGDNRTSIGNTYLCDVTNVEHDHQRRFVEYEEGIYLDYRYWETRAFEMQGRTGGDNWYNRHVVFPFGWGLSYSAFDWNIESVNVGRRNDDGEFVREELTSLSNGGTLAAADYDAYILVEVEVTNTSQVAGKDVVQLYVRTPYTRGGIEKAHVVLMDFAKTGLLAAGASETLTLAFNMFMIASYDDMDLNQNGFRGWETEAGNYTIYISRHSNSWMRSGQWDEALSHDFVVPAGTVAARYTAGANYGTRGNTGFTFRRDPHTPGSSDIINRFDDAREGGPNSNIQFLTRSDFRYYNLETNTNLSWPTVPTDAERLVSEAWRLSIPGRVVRVADFAALDRPGGVPAPWYVPASEMPTQGVILPRLNEYGIDKGPIQLVEMIGVPRTDDKWDTFLNQLTVHQMVEFVDRASFGSNDILDFGIPRVTHADGPAGFVNFMNDARILAPPNKSVFYVSHPIIAATFSRYLAREFGRSIGEEALIGDVRPSGMPYTGWYAPGANIHRTPFSGRNWEYFSADPILAGRMAAQITLGAREFGLISFAKHFAVNDQETDRMNFGLITWATEQSMREIYFRVFELLVKEGRSLGIMSAFNRIGTVWTGADYRLLTEVLRGEWGFDGVIITDFANNMYQDPNRMIRAGGDINLYQGGRLINNGSSATHVTALRRAMHNNLYVLANSNLFTVLVIGQRWAWWVHLMLWTNIGLLIGFLVWGFFALNVMGIIKGTHKLSKVSASDVHEIDAIKDDIDSTFSGSEFAVSEVESAAQKAESENETDSANT